MTKRPTSRASLRQKAFHPFYNSIFSLLRPYFCVSFASLWHPPYPVPPHLSIVIVSTLFYLIASLSHPQRLPKASLPCLLFASHPHNLLNALGLIRSRSGRFGLICLRLSLLNGGL